jgi:hypothetical protein
MFTTEMRERTQEKIKIENISHTIFILVLKYLYTDECDITLEVNNKFLTTIYRIQWSFLRRQIVSGSNA